MTPIPSTPMTRDRLVTALKRKAITLEGDGAAHVAQAIQAHSLHLAIVGKHDGRAVTAERAFEVVYGERLTMTREIKRVKGTSMGKTELVWTSCETAHGTAKATQRE